jgi:hypothetical protein
MAAWESGPVLYSTVLLSLLSPVAVAAALAQPMRTLSKGRFILSQEPQHGPDIAALEHLSSQLHGRQLAQNTEPPGGSYALIADDESFVDMFTSPQPTKQMRLLPGRVVKPCTALAVASGTKAVVDCRGATLDLRCVSSFVIGSNASAELYECHVLWSPNSDFFNIASDTETLRIEEGAVLEQRAGSSTVNCNVRNPSLHLFLHAVSASNCCTSMLHHFMQLCAVVVVQVVGRLRL